MAQNISVFVWKTSNESWKTKLENWHELSISNKFEITGFYMETIVNLQGVSISGVYKTNICISCCRSRWFTCTKPMELSNFTSSPSTSCTGKNLSNSSWTYGCWFSSISSFAIFTKSVNDFTISFGVFSLFMIPFTRGMHWPPAVMFLTNWLHWRFVSRVYLQCH